ncbi:hypothetical protein FKW77_008765 [Venturia effusa]|uniref:Stress response protein NST1 n=1 Tax=Venturia effusa TaxID=50376 RepID=A0A517LJF7_9PEZI|nr:hypothetical protein FKW77_008765 [Venturia effusa]
MAAPTPAVRSSNGASLNGQPPDTTSGVNRKKAKRRAKEAAKRAAENGHPVSGGANVNNGHPSSSSPKPSDQSLAKQRSQHGPAYDDEGEYGSDQAVYDEGSEDGHVDYNPAYVNGHGQEYGHPSHSHERVKKKRKSKITPQPTYNHAPSHHHHHQQYAHPHIPPPPPPPAPAMSQAALRTVQKNQKDRIWNTSTQEERERIKDFWLSLKEDERKSLVKIEKEAVLRKMKEQQKHSCSCTVCGRKRTAIEEELEVLYDAYYEELEQYANDGTPWPPMVEAFPGPPLFKRDDQRANRQPPDHLSLPPHAHRQPYGHVEELPDEEEDDGEDLDEEDLSEDGFDEDDEYSDKEPDELPRPSADFFNFGNSLTVKAGGILTVADDLLKNDGKKFIEMMEQLAERRMQREEDAQYAAATHPSSHNQQGYPDSYRHNHAHPPPPQEDDEDFGEDDDDDDGDYDSQDDDYEEEEEDMDTMTEEQRMQEGRRMFQIFAARMFEQRVLTAYREKVAAERQQKLLEELEEEKGHDAAREAKKAKDAEKRKQKKQAQKQKQAEEKAKKDAEKAAQEAAVKEAEMKRQEELKKKREEQRLKKEEQRKTQEAELARKNAEKLKRQKEEQDRRQEAERKIREAKEAEKKAKEEAKKREREEREARERKSKAEKERKEREAREKAENEAQIRKEAQAVQQAAQAAKRAAAPVVPLPPGLHKQTSNFGSPHVAVATPAIPKAQVPNVRPRQGSQQTSKGSSPKAPSVAAGQKANSPGNANSNQNGPNPVAPRTILSRPSSQPPGTVPQQPVNHTHPIAPPPGMGMPQNLPFGMPPGMSGFHHQGPMMPGMRTPMHNMPLMFSPPQPPIGGQFRPFMPNGMPGPSPGMASLGMPSFGQGPPGFPPQMSGVPPGFGGPIRDPTPAHAIPAQHSRNQSGSSTVEAPIGPPGAQRPAPIQRPSSVKPHEQDRSGHGEMDELSSHLGSSALLDDDESAETLFQDRRPSMAPGPSRAPSNLTSAFGVPGLFTNMNQPQMNGFGMQGSNPSSSWSTPSLSGFQQSNLSSANGWGSSPTGGWPPSSGMSFGHSLPQSGRPRPSQIRIILCETCKALTVANKNSTDGFHEARTVLAQSRERVNPAASDQEMLMLLETEGTTHNGDGSFLLKRYGKEPLDMTVKWVPEGGEGANSSGRIGSIGVGEIGSQIGSPPMGASNPGSANATPFGSLRNLPSLSGLGTVP